MFFDVLALEKKYKTQLETIEEWNYLRNYYREIRQTGINKHQTLSLTKAFKDAFYGFFNWFKKYEYLVFSNNERKKLNDGKFYDTRIDFIIQEIGLYKTLLIETPTNGHIEKELLPIKHIVSRRIIDMLTIFFEQFFKKKDSIELLELIHKEYGITFNYISQINRFNAQYKIYKFWFKLIKPKYIFLICYYDKQYIIKAAHDLGIQVIEIQHGMISHGHTAYYSSLNISQNYIPDYLLSFGKNLAEENNAEFIFNKNKVYPVGSYYLEYLKKNFKKDLELSEYISKYRIVVGVSLQFTIENELIFFLQRVAKSVSDVLFILIPRTWDEKKYNNFKLTSNIIFYPRLDCYQTIMHCNYHCTVYSTCALEVPSLGIPNILVNLNNLTNKYISNMLNKNNTFLVNSEIELVELLRQKYDFKKNEIIKSNETLFVNNYTDNVKKIIYMLKGNKE